MASNAKPMPSNFKVVHNDQLEAELTNAGKKLVVVDFTAKWCGPCQRFAPEFEKLPVQYPDAVFVKCDVDENPQSSSKNGIRAMPTFVFFRSNSKIDELRGAKLADLKRKVEKWLQPSSGGDQEDKTKHYMNLVSLIDKSSVECLNQSNEHDFEACLTNDDRYLESDCDEQLIITVGFIQNVKLHSLKITGPEGFVPKTVKIFINQIKTLDFDKAEKSEAVQVLDLTKDDVLEDVVIPLRFVKFQNVSSVTLFVRDNQGMEDTTRIRHLAFIGLPISTTNMGEFKRISGKSGESH
ncbi:thioredoxin-like protein 1 [Acanthaster planci]|uniref:Thioredoxin-like protein 1 n=1 Tax=Acanthaster planci TaxID=133434 RepID=A0A8B7XUU4_ACAPL|nr:thioredoxin-like protein 1 [Acanthaster planci]